jgi:hypothetical protein
MLFLMLCLYTLLSLSVVLSQQQEEVDSTVNQGTQSDLMIINNAEYPVELIWEHPLKTDMDPERYQSIGIYRNDTQHTITSYENHKFILRYAQDDKIPIPPRLKSLSTMFVKGPRFETITASYDPFENLLSVKQDIKYDRMKDTVRQSLTTCQQTFVANNGTYEDLVACITDDMFVDHLQTAGKTEDLINENRQLAQIIRDHDCARSEYLETTPPVSTYNATMGSRTYVINVLLDLPSAKIWTVDDFVEEEECDFIKRKGHENGLQQATVVDQMTGMATTSDSRRASQGLYQNSYQSSDGDPLYYLYQRAYSLANYHAKLKLGLEGQEGFQIIKYDVNGQYKMHCDGACDGSYHRKGGRVATTLMYCHVADKGGATNFPRANVHINPKKRQAVMFSYKGPNGEMDSGYTLHSGCPVEEGEKWVSTLWMREGVSEHETHHAFDPTGGIPLVSVVVPKTQP